MSEKTGPRMTAAGAFGVLVSSMFAPVLAAQDPPEPPAAPPPVAAAATQEVVPVAMSQPPVPPELPASYYPPPPPTGVYRPFSLTTSIGPGTLIGPGENSLALSYNVVRAGIGAGRNISFVFSFEGSGTPSINPKTRLDSWLKQEVWAAGVQYHFAQRLYGRTTVGLASVSEKTPGRVFEGGRGIGFAAAVGWEFVQSNHVALGVEVNGSSTRYSREFWHTLGLHLALSVF
jgi:hypothetical protein